MRKDGFKNCERIENQNMVYDKMRDDADYLSAEVARKVELAKYLRKMNEQNL